MGDLSKWHMDTSWSLFLDRDGVINRRLPDDYVKEWAQFEFMPGALDAIARLSSYFGRTLVVTNQQGIGKGLMDRQEVEAIHAQMRTKVEQEGGVLDGIYYCDGLEKDNPLCRKPNPGMAYEARRDFPEIQFRRSVMVGDSWSDMAFGQRLGMKTVFIQTKEGEASKLERLKRPVDATFADLPAFTAALPT